MRREFYFQDDKSNKFWTVEVDGQTLVTTNGRVGAKPRETRKEFPTAAAAEQALAKEVAGKLKKGYVEGALAAAPPRQPPDWAAQEMSEDVFWRIIGLFNWKRTGDDDAVLAPAVKALAQMRVADIQRFADLLAEKLHALDTQAHAREIGEAALREGAYFSVDEFLYARCAVVANGRAAFETILADPKQMFKDIEFEAILSVAPCAYERKTKDEFNYDSPISYETYSNRAGWSA